VLWLHTKTFVFFNKQQENAPARIAKRNSEISYGMPLTPSFKIQVSIIDWNGKVYSHQAQSSYFKTICFTWWLLLYRKCTKKTKL